MYSGKRLRIYLSLALVITSFLLKAQKGLQAEYFNDIELKDRVLTRVESKPYLNYYLQSPAPGVNAENFSVRWTGMLAAPATGNYTFFARADDGVRLWVDNKQIIDAWWDQEAADYRGSIELEKGKQYPIRIEYYNSPLHAIFMLSWENPADVYTFMGYTLLEPDSEIPSTLFSLDTTKPSEETPRPTVEKQDQLPAPKVTKVKTTPEKSVRKPVSKKVITTNKPIELRSVHFEQTRFELLSDSHAELDTLATYLKDYPHLKIKIIGHTDYAGDSTANYVLSQQRAKSVADYLNKKGIDQQRIVVVAMGSSQPRVVHEKTDERKQNRRVEFVLLEE